MAKTTTKIFKKGSLDFKGPVKITSVQTDGAPAKAPNMNSEISANAKAILVETDENFSIIEVTCSCGEKLYLKCEHSK